MNIKTWLKNRHGRATALSKTLKVSNVTVSGWATRGVPARYVLDIEQYTMGAVSRYEMAPEIFGTIENPRDMLFSAQFLNSHLGLEIGDELLQTKITPFGVVDGTNYYLFSDLKNLFSNMEVKNA